MLSILSPEVKSDILTHLNANTAQAYSPLSSEELQYRGHLRNFFNRLAAGPGLSDANPVPTSDKPWRDNRAAITVTKEVRRSMHVATL